MGGGGGGLARTLAKRRTYETSFLWPPTRFSGRFMQERKRRAGRRLWGSIPYIMLTVKGERASGRGFFPRILIVRDLASRCTLLSLPCADESAATVIGALTSLFAEHGAPLVLKTDNGPAFIAHETQAFLAAHSIQNLLSPPYTPQYNGSVEATGGSVKAHTAHVAFAQGRAACPSSDDVEAARVLGNATSRPWGVSSPTPAESFADRTRIPDTHRTSLANLIASAKEKITAALGRRQSELGQTPAPALNAKERATVVRIAIRQALVELGHLFIRRPTILSTHSTPVLSGN
jgi:transposase InsO family protein